MSSDTPSGATCLQCGEWGTAYLILYTMFRVDRHTAGGQMPNSEDSHRSGFCRERRLLWDHRARFRVLAEIDYSLWAARADPVNSVPTNRNFVQPFSARSWKVRLLPLWSPEFIHVRPRGFPSLPLCFGSLSEMSSTRLVECGHGYRVPKNMGMVLSTTPGSASAIRALPPSIPPKRSGAWQPRLG